jgi:hypothetical protein
VVDLVCDLLFVEMHQLIEIFIALELHQGTLVFDKFALPVRHLSLRGRNALRLHIENTCQCVDVSAVLILAKPMSTK